MRFRCGRTTAAYHPALALAAPANADMISQIAMNFLQID
jgi:hypothetical protein